MHSSEEKVIDRAPDGTWWVRWADQVELPRRGSQTPQVRMIIEKIDESDPRSLTSDHVFASSDHKEAIFIDAGMIPLLPIGTIIQERKIRGFIPSPIHTFTVNTDHSIELSVSEELPDKPPWWHSELPYRPISKKRFPLGNYLSGHCTILKPNNSTVIIPSSEIFRCFYAPISFLANKFLSAPNVHHYIDDLIQTSESSYCERTNEINIIVRSGFPSDYKIFLANLLIHPYGRRCLNYLSGSLLCKKDNLKAPIPFHTSSLTLSGRCYKLCKPTNRNLLYNITQVDWPDEFPNINYRFDKSNDKGKTTSDSDKPGPFSQYSPTYCNVDGSSEEPPVILNEEEPSAPNTNYLYGLNATWSNQPKESKMPKEHNKSYPDSEGSEPKYAIASEISTGNPFGRKEGVANGEVNPEPADHPITPRLQLILDLMKKINSHPHVHSLKRVSPKVVTHTRSGISAHRFPLKYKKNGNSRSTTLLKWSTVKRDKIEIFRAAFVFEISNKFNRTIYWIEIESFNESYHSIYFYYKDPEHSLTHNHLYIFLTLIARSKGKRKMIASLTLEYLPEIDVNFWRHKFESRNELHYFDACRGVTDFGAFEHLKSRSNNSHTPST